MADEQRRLTKKNQDFVFQLKKQLTLVDMDSAQFNEIIAETSENLLQHQKQGTTAKQLYRSPGQLVKKYLGPKALMKQLHEYPSWVLAVDTSTVLLMFMALFFAITEGFTKSTQQGQGVGIISTLLLSVWGGIIYTVVMLHLIPDPKAPKPVRKWTTWLLVPLILVAWVGGFLVTAFIPTSLNPVLPSYGYVLVAAVTFLGYRWNRKRAGIQSGGILVISKLAQQARMQNNKD